MTADFRSAAIPERLKLRARILRWLREFFDSRGFVEVQTPVLCQHAVIDRHLDPISLRMRLPGFDQQTWYLQTSPEQSMKRLLASGMGSIYQIGPVFRDGEFGHHHNPEFTMCEWYDVGATYEQGQSLLCQIIESLLETTPTERITFEQAFQRGTGLSLFDVSIAEMAEHALGLGFVDSMNWSSDWDDWVNLLFSECVQKTLGASSPTLVANFPKSQAALAVISPLDPRTAERYEIFYRGVELANGYHELQDASVLRQRDEIANAGRELDGKNRLPACDRLLAAMESGIPASCGCALGFDRLVMLASGAERIEEIISFAADRA
jgi:elongation factor P--(R)-beta-lysine ligase